MTNSRLATLPYFSLAVGAAVVADQLIKYIVEEKLPFHQLVEILPLMGLYRTYNEGIAFSMLAGLGDIGLVVLSLGVTLIVLYLRAGKSAERAWAHLGFALIVGGAIGNVIDRVLFGHVIDYILFYTQSWSFAVFNLADAFISLGAALIILDEFLEWRGERKKTGRN